MQGEGGEATAHHGNSDDGSVAHFAAATQVQAAQLSAGGGQCLHPAVAHPFTPSHVDFLQLPARPPTPPKSYKPRPEVKGRNRRLGCQRYIWPDQNLRKVLGKRYTPMPEGRGKTPNGLLKIQLANQNLRKVGVRGFPEGTSSKPESKGE